MSEISQQTRSPKPHRALKITLRVIVCLIAVLLLVFIAARCIFMLPVRDYYAASVRAFTIPGISDGMIHQGLAYDSENGEFLITGYRSGGKASLLSIVNEKTGSQTKRLSLCDADGAPFTGHVGGVTIYGNYVYIADSRGVLAYSRSEINSAENGASVNALGLFSTRTDKDSMGVAFLHAQDGLLYIGEFYRDPNYPTSDSHKLTSPSGELNPALLAVLPLSSDAPLGISGDILCAYSVPGLVQGMCLDDKGRICLSASYGAAFSHIYIYSSPMSGGNAEVLGQKVPLYFLDSSCLALDIKIPPMSEEIVFANGRLYTMCESASNKYIFGKLTSARYCYATDLSACEK